MRTKLALFITVAILSCSFKCFASDKFSYGIKAGLNWRKMTSLKISQNILFSPEHSFPPGLSIGGFLENNLSSHFSLLYELSYQIYKSEVFVITEGVENNLGQEFMAKYLTASILLKYKLVWFFDIYFVIGPDLSYLITQKTEYHISIAYLKSFRLRMICRPLLLQRT